jgi:flagellar basal-body rod protein FlgB
MAFSDIPILSALKSKMKWHQARQSLLAQNIANANTPKFQPQDLKRVDFSSMVPQSAGISTGISTLKTNAAHMQMPAFSSSGGLSGFEVEQTVDWEITPNGNAVSLEDQMMKVTENQMEYQAATTLYSRSLGLLRLAVGQN